MLQGRDAKNNRNEAPTFHLVTAGDSSVAVHGNVYLNSYTAILEDTFADLFRASRVNFWPLIERVMSGLEWNWNWAYVWNQYLVERLMC